MSTDFCTDVEFAEVEAMNFWIKMAKDSGFYATNCWIRLKNCGQFSERLRKMHGGNIMVNYRDLKFYSCERSLQNQPCIEK